MADDYEPTGPEAWDRVGSFLGYLGEVGQAMSRRNLQVWSEVSQNLRSGAYDANKMAADWAKVMSAAMENVQDAADLWSGVPERAAMAGSLPTSFLYFELVPEAGANTYTLPDGMFIRVPPDVRSPPKQAQVLLTGPSPEAATALAGSLAAQLEPRQRGYWLAPYKPGKDLQPGLYTGVVYILLSRAEIPLADLRVVVEAEPRER